MPFINGLKGFPVDDQGRYGLMYEPCTVQSSASATGITLTTDQMFNQMFDRTNAGAAQTDTTPTAAALVAAYRQSMNPDSFKNTAIYWNYRNRSANSVTLAGGTGVTLATGNTNTIAASNTRAFLIVFTTTTPGSEAVTIYSLGASAH